MRSTETYHPISKSFHWLIVVLLVIEFAVGWLMPGIRRSITPAGLVSFHMSFGVLILGVMCLRLLWRLVWPVPVPAPERGTPLWQEFAARWTHYLLYAFVVALPVTGWWLASAHSWTVTLFNFFTLPPLVSTATSERLADVAHVGVGVMALMIIGLHVLAALYHYVILKDKVLQGMLP